MLRGRIEANLAAGNYVTESARMVVWHSFAPR